MNGPHPRAVDQKRSELKAQVEILLTSKVPDSIAKMADNYLRQYFLAL
jgi:hypothetical protein